MRFVNRPFSFAIFVALACLVGVLPVPTHSQSSGAEDIEISLLLERLKGQPTRENIAAAAKRLALADPEEAGTRSLQFALRELLEKPETRGHVLEALARWPVSALEVDVLSLIPSGEPPPPDHELILDALATSGTTFSADMLLERYFNFGGTWPADNAVASKAWRALGPHAIGAALRYFGSHRKLMDGDTARVLAAMIESACRDRAQAASLLPSFVEYVDAASHQAPAAANKGDLSFWDALIVRQVDLAILRSLVRMGSPVALAIAMTFVSWDDPDLRSESEAADFAALVRAPWLLHVRYLPGVTKEERRLLRKLKIVLRHEVAFTVPWKLGDPGLGQIEQGPPAVKPDARGPLLRLEEQRAFLLAMSRSIVASVARDLGLAAPSDEELVRRVDDRLPPGPEPAPPAHPSHRPQPLFEKAHTLALGVVEDMLGAWVLADIDRRGDAWWRPLAALSEIQHTARFVCTKEAERRALVLLALVKARRLKAEPPLSLGEAFALAADADQLLDKVSAGVDPSGLTRTEVVPALRPEPLREDDAGIPAGATEVRVDVVSRTIDRRGIYRERLQLTYSGGHTAQLTWWGHIPLSLHAPLARHPRLLDFIGASLAARELRAQASPAPAPLDDLDLVRFAPNLTMGYLVAALVHPDVPWQHTRDALLLDISPLVWKRLKGRSPPTVRLETPAVSGHLIPHTLRSHIAAREEFDKIAADLRQALRSLLEARAARLVAERSIPIVSGLPDKIWVSIPGGVQRQRNHAKYAALFVLRNQAAAAAATEAGLALRDLTLLESDPVARVERLRTILRDDFREFIGLYRITTRSGAERVVVFHRGLAGLPGSMRVAITRDPGLLWRSGLDLAGATVNADALALEAIGRVIRENAGPLSTNEILERRGLLSSAYLLDEWPIDRAVLESMPVGRSYLAELKTVEAVLSFSRGSVPPDPGPPTAAFVKAIRKDWEDLSSQVEAAVAANVRAIADQVKAHKTEFGAWVFVSIPLGGGAPRIDLRIAYGDLHLTLSTSLGGDLMPIGGWRGVEMPFPPLPRAAAGGNGSDALGSPAPPSLGGAAPTSAPDVESRELRALASEQFRSNLARRLRSAGAPAIVTPETASTGGK